MQLTEDKALADAIAPLQRLWGRVAFNGANGVTREQLRVVAKAVSAEARRANLRAEQLVMLVKESWMTDAQLLASNYRVTSDWVLTEVVSLCICEFYRPTEAFLNQA
jgi:hypothetical protein